MLKISKVPAFSEIISYMVLFVAKPVHKSEMKAEETSKVKKGPGKHHDVATYAE